MLKKFLTYFEILIVLHALLCVDSCIFVFYLIGQSGILFGVVVSAHPLQIKKINKNFKV